MRSMFRNFAPILLAAAIALPALTTGCAVHARVYGPGEDVYYSQWEHETHREHRDYERRNAADQKEYWKWRHNHEDQH
jgi:hypothetical protein